MVSICNHFWPSWHRSPLWLHSCSQCGGHWPSVTLTRVLDISMCCFQSGLWRCEQLPSPTGSLSWWAIRHMYGVKSRPALCWTQSVWETTLSQAWENRGEKKLLKVSDMMKKKKGGEMFMLSMYLSIRKQILTNTIAVFDHVQVKYVTDKFELQGFVHSNSYKPTVTKVSFLFSLSCFRFKSKK